jgi:hypothetical protein
VKISDLQSRIKLDFGACSRFDPLVAIGREMFVEGATADVVAIEGLRDIVLFVVVLWFTATKHIAMMAIDREKSTFTANRITLSSLRQPQCPRCQEQRSANCPTSSAGCKNIRLSSDVS